MNKYIAYIKQEGEGCDYTIACGEKVIEIDENNWREAHVNLVKLILEDYNDDETRLRSAILVEIAKHKEINLDLIYAEAEAEAKREYENREELNEKSEYNRLKKKFDP
ncbi:MAG: hypothetical protein ABIJ34_01710 [archaeon]